MVRQWTQRLATMAMATVMTMASLSAEPGVLAEIWTGIAGGDVANLTGHARYRKTANSVQILKGFSIVSVGDKCGARYSAILSPPVSGEYQFWVAADDSAELWLSPNAKPEQAARIAFVPRYVGEEEWQAMPEQQSKPIKLEKGKGYYLMALHKDLGGADHAAVAWSGPDRKRQVLTGQYLALPAMDQGTKNLVAKAQALEKTLSEFLELAPTELEGFVAKLSPADHKALAGRLNQKLASARKGKEPVRTRKLAKLGTKLVPTPENVIEDAVLKGVLAYEDAYLKTLDLAALEALGAHRSAVAFGAIPTSAKRVRETVQINSRPAKQAREWVSTGLYALPGKKVTVALPEAWVGKELILRIGHHNPASSKNALDCMPDTRRSISLDARESMAVSPYGGLLFIDVPKKVAMKDVPVTIAGGIQAPRFVLGETTDEAWRLIRQNPAPWGELVADRIVIVAHAEALRDLDDPTKLMTWWDDAVTRHEGFYNHDRGMPFRMHVMHYGRMGVSYWPLEWRKQSIGSILDSRKVSAYSDGLFLHEHGHHGDSGAMIFGKIGESSCNWAGYYMKATGGDFAWKDTVETHMLALFDPANSRHQEITEDGWWTRKYTHYWSYACTSMMAGYAETFGWENFKTVVNRFTHEDDPVNQLPIFQGPVTKKPWHKRTKVDNVLIDQMKMDKWLIFLSQQARHDVRPYFAHFAVRPSDAAAKEIERLQLPRWDLVYIPRRPIIVSRGQSTTIPSPTTTALTFSGKLSLSWDGEPTHGKLTDQGDGTFLYRPARWFKGRERLAYTLTNPLGNEFRGELAIHVVANRDNPHLASGRLADVPWGSWRPVQFGRRYREPVVVASIVDAPATKGPAFVVRVRKVTSKGCELMAVAPGDAPEAGTVSLAWGVMEAGTYSVDTHGVDAVATTLEIRPEGLSNQMHGIVLPFDEDRAKLRSACFGQVMSATDDNWSDFYWQANSTLCGFRIGSHYDLEPTARVPETVGYMLLPKGLLQCGDTPVKVAGNLTIGEQTLNVGTSNLKSIQRNRRKALRALGK